MTGASAGYHEKSDHEPYPLRCWRRARKGHGSSAQAPGEYAILSTRRIWNGTLDGCIRQYLQKPDSQKPWYNILVEPEAGTGKTILDWRDIDELAKRSD